MSICTQRYNVLRKITSKVNLCEDLSTPNNDLVIIKNIAEKELFILQKLKEIDDDDIDQFFVTSRYCFEDRNLKYVVMDYVDYDLMDYLEEHAVDEEESRQIFINILFAVKSLLNITGYYHADLKAENIVIDENNKKIKLIDFDVMIRPDEKISQLNGGTKVYFPPEEKKGTTKSYIVWTLGLILYRLLTNEDLPYIDDNLVDYNKLLCTEVPSELSADLLHKCLRLDYRKRISFKKILHQENMSVQ